MEILLRIAGSLASKATKRRLFRSPYLPFQRYLGCYQQAFEFGAVFGYTYRQNKIVLGKLLARPGGENEFLWYLREQARKRLALLGSDPDDFFKIAMLLEQERFRNYWRKLGISQTQIQILESKHKVPVKKAFDDLVGAISTGIGLGFYDPPLIEKLWRNQYELPMSHEQFCAAKDAGIVPSDTYEHSLGISLAQRQKDILAGLEIIVAEVNPALVGLLGMVQPETAAESTDPQKRLDLLAEYDVIQHEEFEESSDDPTESEIPSEPKTVFDVIVPGWSMVRRRWLRLVLVMLFKRDFDVASEEFQARQKLADSAMKAFQLNYGLNFARKYLSSTDHQDFAELLISHVVTPLDRDEVIARAKRYLDRKDWDNGDFGFCIDLAELLTSVSYSANTLVIQQYALLLLGHTNAFVALAFGDEDQASKLQGETDQITDGPRSP